MAKSIGTLKASLTLDSAGFIAGFQRARTATKAGTSDIAGSIANMATNVIGNWKAMAVGALASVFSLRRLAESFDRVDRSAKLADKLGITFESMKKLSIAAEASGTDVETLARAMVHMNKTIGSGGKALDERLLDVAASISTIKDPAERLKKANEIFGKTGFEILTFINSAKGIRDTTRAIDAFGLSLTRADASKVEKANDAVGRLTALSQAFVDKLSVSIAPALEEFATKTLGNLDRLNNALDVMGDKFSIATGFAAGFFGTLNREMEQLVVSAELVAAMFGRFPKLQKLGGAPAGGAASAGGMGGLFDGQDKPLRPGAFEQNSVEAARAIQDAGGDGTGGIISELKAQIRLLQRIADNGDPIRGKDETLFPVVYEARL